MSKKEVLTVLFTLLIGIGTVWVWLSPSGLRTAPDIALKIIDGRILNLKQLQGNPILITFWATTCTGCVKEIPHLVDLYNEFSSTGFQIIGVAMSYDPPHQVVEMTKRRQIPYPVALDIDGNVASAFGNVLLTPTSFLIAPDGTIVKHKIGEMDIDKIRKEITVILSAQNKYSLPQS